MERKWGEEMCVEGVLGREGERRGREKRRQSFRLTD